ncbi:AAA family ATPase [bacterium]|nr:AAA family ATPase [bacterium]
MDLKYQLLDLMNRKNYSTAFVANATGIAKSTLSMWINGNYKGDNSKIADKINNFVQLEIERKGKRELPICDISILKYIFEIARTSHTQGTIGVCVGEAGLGKTIAVREYAKQNLNAILIESDSTYKEKALLKEIHKRLSLSGKGSRYDLMCEVVNKLNNSGRLLIIDEAENLPYGALEIVRRIHDKAGIGIFLVGRNILVENLRGANKQYDQLYSRVNNYKFLDRLNINDIKKILLSVNQNPDLAEDFLTHSKGNTRRLEHLILHSISVSEFNGTEVDNTVIEETSKLLMV